MMTENAVFRTGFGGFNKQDVLQYIQAQQLAHAQELQQVQEQLAAARDKAAQLEEENAQLQKKMDDLNK